MKIEELLYSRFKVIADYPFNNHFKLNEIVVLNEIDEREHLPKEYFVAQETLDSRPNAKDVTIFHENYFNKYQHLFKKLEWWEDRKVEEMPKYVKSARNVNYVVKVDRYYDSFYENAFWDSEDNLCFLADFIPATQQEYEAQLIG